MDNEANKEDTVECPNNHDDDEKFIMGFLGSFHKKLLGKKLCVTCTYDDLLSSLIVTMVYNGAIEPAKALKIAMESISRAIDMLDDEARASSIH